MNISDLVTWAPGMSLEELERLAVLKAYQHFRGNKMVTANALKICVRTLDHKLEKYNKDSIDEQQRIEKVRKERYAFLRRARGEQAPDVEINRTGITAHAPSPGDGVESPQVLTAQRPLPMPERPEVQIVLPKQAPPRDNRKSR